MSSVAESDNWKALVRKQLGRLGVFGLEAPWQAALLLPDDWDDLMVVVSDYSDRELREGRRAVFAGRIPTAPTTRFDRTPRLLGYLVDSKDRRIGWTMFGDTRDLVERLKSSPEQAVIGTLSWFHGWWLRDCEFVSLGWLGRLMPRYPGKREVMTPESVRERVRSLLPHAIPIAAEWLADTLRHHGDEASLCRTAGVDGWTIQDILKQAHTPDSVTAGQKARLAIERLAALGIIDRANVHQDGVSPSRFVSPRLTLGRVKRLPFALTAAQTAAVREILADLASGRTMRRILTGDVGSGKTAVYGLAAVACLDGGGRVAVLLPNQALVEQVAREFSAWWPDLAPLVLLGGDQTPADEPLKARFLVGTTALLQRHTGPLDLVIVDEQHKFSREQREAWHGNAHLLEVSATCIPRSQALVEFGVVRLSQLRAGHANKTIHTRIWSQEERGGLFAGVRATLQSGYQVLVIYPRRGDNNPDDEESCASLPGVEDAYQQWEKLFPGMVRLAHGGMDDRAIDAALRDIREGRAQILVGTTVVEVGLNLPKLRRVVVVHAERFGIVTLHQLRGRVARLGGTGYCDLFLPRPTKEETRARLQILVKTADGFQVASRDLERRGFGDLGRNSEQQHGADRMFMFGCHVRVSTLEEMLAQVSAKEKNKVDTP